MFGAKLLGVNIILCVSITSIAGTICGIEKNSLIGATSSYGLTADMQHANLGVLLSERAKSEFYKSILCGIGFTCFAKCTIQNIKKTPLMLGSLVMATCFAVKTASSLYGGFSYAIDALVEFAKNDW